MNQHLTKVQKTHQRVTRDVNAFLANGGKIKQLTTADNAGYGPVTPKKAKPPEPVLTNNQKKYIRLRSNQFDGMKRISALQRLAKRYQAPYETIRAIANGAL